MRNATRLTQGVRVMTMVVGLFVFSIPARAQNTDQIQPTWTLGSGVGIMGNTPGGTAFNFNVYADRFMSRSISSIGMMTKPPIRLKVSNR